MRRLLVAALLLSFAPKAVFAAETLTVRGCNGELILLSELSTRSVLSAEVISPVGKTLTGAVLRLEQSGRSFEATANSAGRIEFQDIEPGDLELCPLEPENFQITRAELHPSAAVGGGMAAAGIAGAGIAGVGIAALSDSGSSNSSASPALSTDTSPPPSSQPSTTPEESSTQLDTSSNQAPERPQVARRPERKPVHCDRVTQNIQGNTVEGCRVDEEPAPVSPIS